MRSFRRQTSLIAVLAVVALLGAISARLGHVHDDVTDSGQYAYCQLCLHLERAGTPPAGRLLPVRLRVYANARTPPESAPRTCNALTGSHLPRAPPLAHYPLS